MEHIKLIVVTVAFIVASTSSIASERQSSPPRTSQSEINITYSLAQPDFVLHEPVVLILKIENSSPTEITLDLGQDRKADFSFSLIRPDGSRVSLPQNIREGLATSGLVSVQSTDTYSQNLLLNEWYNFATPGKYEIDGRLTTPIALGTGFEKDPGFRATLTIAPRDEIRLIRVCDALANQVEGSHSYEEAAQAALALSYVNDPVAVHYLRRALFSGRLVDPIAIAGLERIQNNEAVDALVQALTGESGDTVTLARAALEQIQKQTGDTQLRERIETVLKQYNR